MKNAKALEVLSNWLQLAYHDADGTDKDSAELYEALYTVFKLISYDKSKIERLEKKIGKLEKIQDKLQSTLFKQEDNMQIIAKEKQEYLDELIRVNEENEKLRKQADKQDMTMNALIRIALEKYLKEAAE